MLWHRHEYTDCTVITRTTEKAWYISPGQGRRDASNLWRQWPIVNTLHELRMQLSREVAMEAFDSAVRKKHILAEHQREDRMIHPPHQQTQQWAGVAGGVRYAGLS